MYKLKRRKPNDFAPPSLAAHSTAQDSCRTSYLVQAEIFDVDVASESGIEEQIPAGVVIVVVDVYAIAVPFPIAAAIEVVGGYYPVRIVVKDHATRAVVDPPRDEHLLDALIMTVRISAPWPDAVVLGIPASMGVVRIVPALVLAVVVPVVVAANFTFLLTFVLAVVVPVIAVTVVVAVPLRCCDRERSCQSYEQSDGYDLAHKSSLQKLPCRRSHLCPMSVNLPVRLSAVG